MKKSLQNLLGHQAKKCPADDNALFRDAVQDVAPLILPNKIEHPRKRRKPIPHHHLLDERQALQDSLSDHISADAGLETGEELSYARDGISKQILRKLRRGHWVLQDQLDLHGMTTAEARAALITFLSHCDKRGHRCVRIIHGKGLRSKNREPVLKQKVANWLMQRDEIVAFCQALPADGGSGAVVVLLKSHGRSDRN